MSVKKSVFVRESTGLVKSVSLIDAVALNITNMSAGIALSLIGFTMVLLPSVSGVNLVYGSIIGLLVTIPQIIVYTMFSKRMPRTGGDYVWISRTLGGFWGNLMSFGCIVMTSYGYAALTILSGVFAIGSVGVTLGYQGLLGLALPGNIPGGDPVSQFVLGSVIFTIFVAITIVKPRLAYKIVTVLMAICILSTVLGIGVLLVGGQQGVIGYMNSFNNANLTYTAVAASYSGPQFSLGPTLFLLPFYAIFIYPWINAAPAVSSELKGKDTIKWNATLASIIVFVLVTASFGAMYYAGGFDFITAALSNTTLVYTYSFNFWTLAMGVANNVALQWIIGIGWILWSITIYIYLIIGISRYVLAEAFDRFLPAKLADVSQKYGSPVLIQLITLIVTVILLGFTAFYYGTLVALYGGFILYPVYFVAVGLAAIVYAKREKGSARTAFFVCGIIMAIVNVWISAQFLLYPGVWGGTTLGYGFAAISVVTPAIIYAISKQYHARRGIDIGLAFKQIPPE